MTKINAQDTRFASCFILLVASIGVVYYHHNGSFLYIGNNYISIDSVLSYFKAHSLPSNVITIINGISAMVGLFFINSGYGLTKQFKYQDLTSFYKKRFYKIYLYSLLCALLCTLIVYIVEHQIITSYWSSFIPIFGFYQIDRDFPVSQYWFLSSIFIYYLFFPLVVDRFSNLTYAVIILLSLVYGYVSFCGYIHSYVDLYHSTIFRFCEFATGIYIAKNHKIERLIFTRSIKSLLLGMLIFSVGYILLYINYLNIFTYILTSIGSYIFLAQVAQFLKSINRINRIICILSAGTFTLYLLHLVSVRYICRLYMITIYDAVDHFNGYLAYLTRTLLIIITSAICLYLGGLIENKYTKIMEKYFT